MLHMYFTIHFLTLLPDTKEPPSDDVGIRSILEKVNLIQMSMATNCDVHTYNQQHYNGDEYFIISSHFFDFWITISVNKNHFSENIFLSLDTLDLENKKYWNTDQKLLVNIVAQTPGIVLFYGRFLK